jgi:hypothetical protein
VPDQRFGIRARLAQLADLPAWPAAAGAVPGSDNDDVRARLAGIVDAAVVRHGMYGYAKPVMLVHAATAPNAVLRALPALPETLWAPSLAAAWAATAAVTAAYAPPAARPAPSVRIGLDVDEVVQRATATGDAHAIKFVDTAIDTYIRGGDLAVLATAAQSTEQIAGD